VPVAAGERALFFFAWGRRRFFFFLFEWAFSSPSLCVSSPPTARKERKREKPPPLTLMKGSPCLYRFVKMRSSSAIPPKLVRSAGGAGAEAGPGAEEAAAAEAAKGAEGEEGDDEREDAAPAVDAALLLFCVFQGGRGSIGIGQVGERVLQVTIYTLAVKRDGKRAAARRRRETERRRAKRVSIAATTKRHGGGSESGNGNASLFLFLVPRTKGSSLFLLVTPTRGSCSSASKLSLSQQRKGYLPKALLKPRHSGAGRASEHRSCCSRETNPKIRRRVRAHALCVLRFPPSRPSRPREESRALPTSERATRARKVSEQAKQKKRKSEANRSRGKKGEKDFALDEKKHKSLFFLSFTARTS
jgi:hypothetical protein